MRIKTSPWQRIFDVFNIAFILLIAFITIYPIWYVFCASLSNNNEILAHTGLLMFPKQFTLDAYKMAFNNQLILKSYGNTIFIVSSAVCINIILTFFGGYVLSRKNVYWNKFFSILVIITMFFSGGLIPTYLLVTKTLNMNNSFWALLLPQGINVFNLIIVRTNLSAIPDSLEEAAKIDGAGHFKILFSIIIPLSKAIMGVMVLYYAVQHWNSWFDASIYIKDRVKYPLQLILREILINNDTEAMTQGVGFGDQMSIGETIKYAVTIIATLPILCVFPFLQKYFTKGVMVGAVKG